MSLSAIKDHQPAVSTAVEIQGATRATEAELVVMAAAVPLTCESTAMHSAIVFWSQPAAAVKAAVLTVAAAVWLMVVRVGQRSAKLEAASTVTERLVVAVVAVRRVRAA
jgi:hypothetical protein